MLAVPPGSMESRARLFANFVHDMFHLTFVGTLAVALIPAHPERLQVRLSHEITRFK